MALFLMGERECFSIHTMESVGGNQRGVVLSTRKLGYVHDGMNTG